MKTPNKQRKSFWVKERSRSGSIFQIPALLAIVLILNGCGLWQKQKELDTVKASGHIEGSEARLGVPVPGKVASVAISEGDTVAKGQTLLCLDDEAIRRGLEIANRLVAEAQISKAELESILNRMKRELNRARSETLPGLDKESNRADAGAIKAFQSATNKSPTENESRTSAPCADLSKPDETIASLTRAQDQELDQALAAQRKTIEEASKVAGKALDDWYQQQCAMLAQAKKAMQGSHHKFFFSDRFNLTKNKALQEVFNTKQSALDEVYRTKRTALEQTCKAQETTLEETVKAKKNMMEQIAAVENTSQRQGLDTIKNSLASVKDELSQRMSVMQKAMSDANELLATQKKELTKTQRQAALHLQINEAELRLAALKSEIARAIAARSELIAKRVAYSIVSAGSGICTACNVQPGETVAPGQVLIRVVDPHSLFVRAYVAEGDLARIRIGQRCRVFLDSSAQPLAAHVVAIDAEASFTPENVYFKDDRLRQAFGVKLALDRSEDGREPTAQAKAGMPADVEIDVGCPQTIGAK